MKKENVIDKFRKFWNKLKEEDKEYLYDILTALRHNDIDENSDYKFTTTARIRYGLFKNKTGTPLAINNKNLTKNEIIKRNRWLNKTVSHFRQHFSRAIEILTEFKELPKEEKYEY